MFGFITQISCSKADEQRKFTKKKKQKEAKKTMKIITINLPNKYLDAIQTLQDLGTIPSRSEAIRIALKDFLKNELEFYEDLDDETFKCIINENTKNDKKTVFNGQPKINSMTTIPIKKSTVKNEKALKQPTTIVSNDLILNQKKQPSKPNKFVNLISGKEHLTLNLIASYLNENTELSTIQLLEKLGLNSDQESVVKKTIGQIKARFSDLIEITKTKQGYVYKVNKTILEKALKEKKPIAKSTEYFRENNVPKEIVPSAIAVKNNLKPIYNRNINE